MRLFFYTLSLVLLASLPAAASSFSDGHGDSLLTGWSTEGPRPWLESGGYARPQDGFSGRGFLVSDLAQSPDGSFSATLACEDALGSTLCRYGGLLFRYTDSTRLYALYLQEVDTSGASLNNKLYLLTNTTNTGVPLGPSKMELASGLNLSGYSRHYPLRVAMDGPKLTFYLGAQQVAQIEDYENLGGRVGYFYDVTWNRYASLDSADWIESASPRPQSFFPKDNALHVPIGRQPLLMHFSTPMAKGSGFIHLVDGDGDTLKSLDVQSAQVGIDAPVRLHGFEGGIEEWTWGAGVVRSQSNEQASEGSYSLKAVVGTAWQSVEAFYSGEWSSISGFYDWSAFDTVVVDVYTDQAGAIAFPFVRSSDILKDWQYTQCTLTAGAWTRCALPLSLALDAGKIFSFGLQFSVAGSFYVDNVGLKKAGLDYVALLSEDSAFALDQSYHVLIDSGALQSASLEAYAGFSDAPAWNFSTDRRPTAITLADDSLSDGSPTGSAVGRLGAQDPDGAEPFTFKLVPGSGDLDNASFALSGDTLKTLFTASYSTKASYSLRLEVNDGYFGLYEQVLTVRVSPTPASAPTDLFLTDDSIAENAPANTLIGLLSAADPDAGESFSYALVTGIGDTDNASFSVSGAELRSAALFDYEVKSSYSVRLQVTDANGLSFAKAFTLSVNNVNDLPPVLSGSQYSIPRTSPVGTLIGTLVASDSDQIGAISYSLATGNTDSTFALDASSGDLTLAKSARLPSYSLTVQASDGQWSVEAVIQISVTGFPRWDSLGVNITVMDSASQTMRLLVWHPGDTIALDSGNRVRLELRVLDTAGGWQAFALSSQADWSVETELDTLRGWWKANEIGLQGLALGLGVDYALDTLVIPIQVNQPESPRLALLEMGAIYSLGQKAVSFSATDAPVLPGVPDRLIFRFSAASRGIPQWSIEPAEAGFLANTQDSIWVLQWNSPSPGDQGLSITLRSGNGETTTLKLAWTYSTTSIHAINAAGFVLHPELHAFSLPHAGLVRISVLDASGRLLQESVRNLPAGLHTLPWSTPRGALARIEWEGHSLLLR